MLFACGRDEWICGSYVGIRISFASDSGKFECSEFAYQSLPLRAPVIIIWSFWSNIVTASAVNCVVHPASLRSPTESNDSSSSSKTNARRGDTPRWIGRGKSPLCVAVIVVPSGNLTIGAGPLAAKGVMSVRMYLSLDDR